AVPAPWRPIPGPAAPSRCAGRARPGPDSSMRPSPGWTSTRSIPALSVSWGPFSHHVNFAGDLCRALGSDLRSEKALGQGIEGRGLAGAQEAVPGRGCEVAAFQVSGHESGVHVLGGLLGAG